MILYYKKLSEKNENGYDIRTDEEGKKYIRHETKMKILGLTTGEAYYRMSDKNGQQTSNSITATPFHIKCSKKGYLNFVYKSSSPFLEIIKHFFHQTSLFKKKDVFLYTAKEYLRRCTVQKNKYSVSNACVRYGQECTINMLLGQVHSRYHGGMGQDITKGNAFFSYRYRGKLYSIILIRKN